MKYDSHVHIGFFKTKEKIFYFNPSNVISDLKEVGITHAVVMSTTQNAGIDSFFDVIREFQSIENTGIQLYPVLWCLPEMLKSFSSYISAYSWRALKVHALSQNWKDSELDKLFSYASVCNLPVIIHTGFSKYTSCRRYEKFIEKYKAVNVILAHGQPERNVEKLVSKYSNCYLDTAFMHSQQVIRLLKSNLESKILYGSDYPVQYAHPNTRILLEENSRNISILRDNDKNFNEINFLQVFDFKENIGK